MPVMRYDTGELHTPHRTDEGYLFAEGFATRTGIFLYMRADGTIRRELRLPDEVSNPDSLGTLGGKPVTLEHPPVRVDSRNAKKYQVGVVGDEIVFTEGGYVKVRVVVHRGDAVSEIDRGKKELSCGYECDIDPTPGMWQGQHYDAVQRNIRYNHLAVVDKGRAGASVRLRVDSDDAVMTATKEDSVMKRSLTFGTVRFDEVDGDLAGAIDAERRDHEAALAQAKADGATFKAQVDALQKQIDAKQGELDALKKKHDDLTSKLKAKEEKGDSDALAYFNTRLPLVQHAETLKLDGVDKLDNAALKKAILSKLDPELKVDGLSEGYIDGYLKAELKRHDSVEKIRRDAAGRVAGINGGAPAPVGDYRADMEAAESDYYGGLNGEKK